MRRMIQHLMVGVVLIGLFSGTIALAARKLQGSAIQYVEPPKGSSLRYVRDGKRWEYTAPANFEDPIKICFEPVGEEASNRPPDVLVWADVINWNDTTQSATASGRIIVDDQKEYRIETTYVEYNHISQQIYCPNKVKVIQRIPDSQASNLMVATSAIVTLDDNGIREAKFDKLLETRYIFEKGSNPLDKKSKKTGQPKAEEKSEPKPSQTPRSKKNIGGPIE